LHQRKETPPTDNLVRTSSRSNSNINPNVIIETTESRINFNILKKIPVKAKDMEGTVTKHRRVAA